MSDFDSILSKRLLFFFAWIVLSSLLFWKPVAALTRLSLSQGDASHLIIIPLIAASILYLEHEKIFQNTSFDKALGGSFLLLACVPLFLSFHLAKNEFGLQLSSSILALVLLWVSGFSLLFGKAALKTACFPLLFLLLMVPIPTFVLGRVIFLLQEGSAWITGLLFDLVGVPALRDGLVFHLARVSIEVAKECSGIRSSMALFILALLVAHFRLRNLWNKILFVVIGLLMMIVKNGMRIATLTLLAVYVDPSFLFGRLHYQGGVVFFLLALLLLLPVLLLLERAESKKRVSGKDSPSAATKSHTTSPEL